MSNQKLRQAAQWLEQQAEQHQYAELVIHVKIHAGQIKEIQKTVTIKEREDTATPGAAQDHKQESFSDTLSYVKRAEKYRGHTI